MKAKVRNQLTEKKDIIHQKAYEYRNLSWDTNYFGVKSGRLTLNSKVQESDYDEIQQLIKEDEFLVIDNINNDARNNILIADVLGGYLVDINIQLHQDIFSKIKSVDIKEDNVNVINNMKYNNEIVNISRSSYRYSRFFNDPILNKDKATNVYSHWIESSFLKEDKYFLCYYDDFKIVGYILFTIDTTKEKCIIELIAVDKNRKGKNIGTGMIKYLRKYLEITFKNIREIQVGTQVDNILAINFYVKNGFKFKQVRTVYHLWNYNKFI